ncbi:MAG: lysophospholipid acyltransferase family protein [Leptonema sp. (in: bacteria)]
MKLANFFIFLITYFIGLFFRILPYFLAQKLGYIIIVLFFLLIKKYKKIIYSNLQHAFPEKNHEFYHRIYKANLKHMGRLLADSFLKARMKKKWFQKYLILDENTSSIEKEIDKLLEKQEPVIVITGHLGSWETLAQYLGYRFPNRTLIIYKKIKNSYLDQWLLKLRSTTGAKLYSMEETFTILKLLEKGNLLAIAPDQNAGGSGLFINFLNRPASTYKGPALFGYSTKAHIYFVTMIYQKNTKLKIIYEYLGKIQNSSTNKEAIIQEWTQKWVSTLEKYVKKFPEQYFWAHQRWKTTPEIMERLQKEKLKKRGKIP